MIFPVTWLIITSLVPSIAFGVQYKSGVRMNEAGIVTSMQASLNSNPWSEGQGPISLISPTPTVLGNVTEEAMASLSALGNMEAKIKKDHPESNVLFLLHDYQAAGWPELQTERAADPKARPTSEYFMVGYMPDVLKPHQHGVFKATWALVDYLNQGPTSLAFRALSKAYDASMRGEPPSLVVPEGAASQPSIEPALLKLDSLRSIVAGQLSKQLSEVLERVANSERIPISYYRKLKTAIVPIGDLNILSQAMEERPVHFVSATIARHELGESILKIAYQEEWTVLRRNNQEVAAIIPIKDLLWLIETEEPVR